MPQLDIVPYSSEIMWLVVTFFSFYFFIVRTALPKLYRILQFRHKKIIFVSYYVSRGLKEKMNYSVLINGGNLFVLKKIKVYLNIASISTQDLFVSFFLNTLKSKRSLLTLVLYSKTTPYGIISKLYNYKLLNQISLQK